MSTPLIDTAYAAIRSTDGHEWIDANSIACEAEEARRRASTTDRQIQAWARYNPVRRIVRIEIREVTV